MFSVDFMMINVLFVLMMHKCIASLYACCKYMVEETDCTFGYAK